jgi:hypothetical protein
VSGSATARKRGRKAAVVERVRRDPVWFARHVLGIYPWSKQREILTSVRDNRRTAVKACHGPGKTYTAAAAIHWFLRLPNSRVVTTAPTWDQVKNLLWHEIRAHHEAARIPLGGRMLQTEYHLDDGRYAIGLSVKQERPEAFQGHHAENILVVYDEASGIPPAITEAGEGYMTTPGARMLLLGNPTRTSGEFYDAFHTRRASYNPITISAFDLPWSTGEEVPDEVAAHLTSREWVEERRHWEGTALWDVKVLGEFPRTTDDAVIALADVEDAQARTVEVTDDDENRLAVDVARFGSDETVFAHRLGNRIRIVKHYVGRDTMETAGWAKRLREELGATRIVVDDSGLGGGVTDRLKELGETVVAFNASEKALDEEMYPNRRSESWFTFSERLSDLDLDPDSQLAADLTAPRWKMDSRGRRVVEKKEETKKRIGRSPDRADAALMTLVGGIVEPENLLPVF